MNSNLGRDNVPWNNDVWKGIDDAALQEVGRIRVAQKVLPGLPIHDALSVPADIVNLGQLSIVEGKTKPLMEISIDFHLTHRQVDDEAASNTGRTLARLAAKSIALAEDILFFEGKNATLPQGVTATNSDSVDGLLNVAEKPPIPVPLLDPKKPGVYGQNTFKAVTDGISRLTKKAQPGPYALILVSEVHADAYAPSSTLVTTADRIIPLVPGGFYGTSTLPVRTGLLISLGGDPTTIYVGQEIVTAFPTVEDKGTKVCFNVFERIQIIARDPRALVKLEFEE